MLRAYRLIQLIITMLTQPMAVAQVMAMSRILPHFRLHQQSMQQHLRLLAMFV